MELTARKQAVLKAIVKAYIETGEPVGSKVLTTLIENSPSSATLRNEMSELCELGFLEQPHTSAGRVPTSSAYRVYVNSLMSPVIISDSHKEFIESRISQINSAPEKIPSEASKILSDLTGLPVTSCLLTKSVVKIKRVELLPISRNSLMLLVITQDGRTRNKVIRVTGDLTSKDITLFKDTVDSKIKGKPTYELTLGYMQGLAVSLRGSALSLMPLFTAIFETIGEIEASSVDISGVSRLYNICADEITATKIMSLVNRRDPIISLLEGIKENVGVVFGADTAYSELKTDTIIAAKFTVTDKYKGYLGIIGPNRISYEKLIPCIKYTAERLTQIMTAAQKDMED